MELVLATLPIPSKGDPKGISQGSSEAIVPTVPGPSLWKNCNKKEVDLK